MKETENMKIEKDNKRKEQLLEESTKLEEKTNQMKETQIQEMIQLEEWSFCKFNSLLFDSEICHWSQGDSTFTERILNKQHLVMLIETTDKIKFGCYIDSMISSINETIKDNYSFIFTFKKNMKGKYEMEDNCDVIKVNEERDDILFTFGKNDIVVMKKNVKQESFCHQDTTTIDYNGRSNVMIGKEQFKVKQLQVFEMIEDEETEQKKEEYRKHREEINKKRQQEKEKKEIIQKERENRETEKLKEIKEETKQLRSKEITQIENFTELEFANVIFDSEYCEWNKNTSTFTKRIKDNENLLFIVEVNEKITIGGFVYEKIEEIDKFIWDRKSFIFTSNEEGFQMFSINEYSKSFILYNSKENELFSFGERDLKVMKENNSDKTMTEQLSYDMEGNKSLLIGYDNVLFTPKRIQVITFVESERTKIKKQMKLNQRLENERKEMERKFDELKEDLPNELKIIEKSSEMTMTQLVFDSEICD